MQRIGAGKSKIRTIIFTLSSPVVEGGKMETLLRSVAEERSCSLNEREILIRSPLFSQRRLTIPLRQTTTFADILSTNTYIKRGPHRATDARVFEVEQLGLPRNSQVPSGGVIICRVLSPRGRGRNPKGGGSVISQKTYRK